MPEQGEVPEHALKHAAVREVALHISSQGVREGDRGRVIVAGSMQLGEIASNGAAGTMLRSESGQTALQLPVACATGKALSVRVPLCHSQQLSYVKG